MKKVIHVFTIIILSLSGLYAQKWGLGVSLPASSPAKLTIMKYYRGQIIQDYHSYNMPLIRIPININSNFSLEPELGIIQFYSSYYNKSDDFTEKSTITALMANLYFKFPQNLKSIKLYPAFKIGINYLEDNWKEAEVGSSSKIINADRFYIIGLISGGEYFFNQHFSLGGETQLEYILYRYKETNDFINYQSVISTSACLTIRWYFKQE